MCKYLACRGRVPPPPLIHQTSRTITARHQSTAPTKMSGIHDEWWRLIAVRARYKSGHERAPGQPEHGLLMAALKLLKSSLENPYPVLRAHKSSFSARRTLRARILRTSCLSAILRNLTDLRLKAGRSPKWGVLFTFCSSSTRVLDLLAGRAYRDL